MFEQCTLWFIHLRIKIIFKALTCQCFSLAKWFWNLDWRLWVYMHKVYLLKLVIFVLFLFVFFVLYPFTLHKHYMWLWTTKRVIRSNVFFFIHPLKADEVIFPFIWDTTIWKFGIKISNEILMHNAHYKSKMKFWYIYSWKFTKYIHGTWSLLNIMMIFDIKEKSIILTHTMYCWLLLHQIYLCDLWMVLCFRVTYK